MGRYVVYDKEEIDRKIDSDLSHIIDVLKIELRSIRSIILVGSFGRGEGSVIIEDGEIKPLNDYDLVVVSVKKVENRKLRQISNKLANQLKIDFVDISIKHPKTLRNAQVTMHNYDMKYGSQIIYGDNTILNRIPDYKASRVPLWAGIELLFNRLAGMLGGFSIEYFSRELRPAEKQYLINQINHLIIAWIDVLNLSQHKYSHSYREKLEIFLKIFSKKPKLFPMSNELLTYATKAIEYKLKPSSAIWDDILLDELFEIIRIGKDIFLHVMSDYLDQDVNMSNVAKEYLRSQKNIASVFRNFPFLYKLHERGIMHWSVLKEFTYPLNHLMYISLPYILFSFSNKNDFSLNILDIGEDILSRILKIAPPQYPAEKWEYLRKKAFSVWEALYH